MNAPGHLSRVHALTADLSNVCRDLNEARLPVDIVRLAQQCLFDWLSVAISGSSESATRIVSSVLDDGGSGASVIARSRRTTERNAAMVNGTMGHALDFDDVNLRMHGHPTAVIAPSIIALAEAEGASGQDLLRAFVVGYQVAGRLGAAMGETHYARGFHATATVGTVAAAAGCASLLSLDEAQSETALALAATQGAGLKAMFGTMAKPFHAGRAAEAGLLAARLAHAGLTARDGVFDHHQGFGPALSDDFDPSRSAPDWEIEGNLFKYHAACYLTHSAIEAARALQREASIESRNISKIEVHVPQGHRSACDVCDPRTGLDVKFSIRHLVAMALVGRDTADLSLYSAETATDPDLSALRGRVELIPTDAARYDATIVVTSKGGERHEASWNVAKPEADLDRQEDKLRTKSRTIVEPVLGYGSSDRLWSAVEALSGAGSVRDVMMATGAGD